ncbi:MAG: hypothetical protein KA185_14140 [Vitreoscilla sp.]|mgnify:CR=1 FL=1|nr:hypothetical protein [Vitreoscilla sp.]
MVTARKAAAKPAATSAVKKAPVRKPAANKVPARKAPAKPAAMPKPPVPEVAKPAKLKLVRDGFTIPAAEYAALGELKQRALAAGHPAKKSELLRAGIKLLAVLTDKALLAALANVPAVKTGRPGKK